jgi:hypothetical protein
MDVYFGNPLYRSEVIKMTKLEEILKLSRDRAQQILAETVAIRESYAVGRPNSSSESTTAGALSAMSVILSALPD